MKNLFKTLISLCFLPVWLPFSVAAAELDFSTCQTSFEKVLTTDLNCELSYNLMHNEALKSIVSGFAKSFVCRVPIQAKKADIYTQWIQKDLVKIPKLAVDCKMTGLQGEIFALTSQLKPECVKQDALWQCQLNIHQTKGLGPFGEVIENAINQNKPLKKAMAARLALLD